MVYNGGGTLEVTGKVLGTVTSVESILPPDTKSTKFEVLEALLRLALTHIHNGLYVGGGVFGDAFLRIFCCNAFDEQYEPPYPNLPNFASVKEVFLDLLQSQQDSPKILPTALSRYLYFVQINSLGGSFMKMQEGYLGLAPAAAQEGDQVCIILGSEAPLVLRPVGQDE